MTMHIHLGFPEPDAGCPFAIWFVLGTDILLIAGVLNRGRGVVDLESERLEGISVEGMKSHLHENGLIACDVEGALWWMMRCFERYDMKPFDEWELVEIFYPHVNTLSAPEFVTALEGNYNPYWANQTSEIVHPETGVFFPLSESILADGIKGLALLFKQSEETQRQLIDAVVESTADLAMDEEVDPNIRIRWDLALLAYSLRYDAESRLASESTEVMQKKLARDIVEHNRRAIQMGATGSQIPLVHVWTHQQLLNAVTMAQLMARPS